MKSLLFAPALLSLVSNDSNLKNDADTPATKVAIVAKVEFDRPLLQIDPPAMVVPIVAERGDRLDGLRENLDDLAASLKVTQDAMEKVAGQRDDARKEVRALAMANHEVLKQMHALRAELDEANKERAVWKEQAAMMKDKLQEQAMAQTDLQKFRREMQNAMTEFQAMKGDIARARSEFQDPIERAALKKDLAESNQETARLGNEIEMALQARRKAFEAAVQTREQMEAQIAELREEVEDGRVMRDELRNVNAVKMKALADVEVLKKQLETVRTEQVTASADLEATQEGMDALRAEKTAAVKAQEVALRERDEAQAALSDMRGELMTLRMDVDNLKRTASTADERAGAAEAARDEALGALETAMKAAAKEREEMKESLATAKEDLQGLTEAKIGLEELLFRKNAEMRKLNGQLRKFVSAKKKDAPDTAPAEDSEERDTTQALAD